MARKYLFDTGFLTLVLTDTLPEKWLRPWNEVRKGRKKCYIIEPVIMEAYYQLMMKKGMKKENAKNLIMKIKSLESINIHQLDDNDSFTAGLYRIKFKKFSLSFIDCLVLAVASRLKLKIYTTDSHLKMAAKKMDIQCDYLPI